MLEKPDAQDEQMIACLQVDYGLPVAEISFLPLGADLNTAVLPDLVYDLIWDAALEWSRQVGWKSA